MKTEELRKGQLIVSRVCGIEILVHSVVNDCVYGFVFHSIKGKRWRVGNELRQVAAHIFDMDAFHEATKEERIRFMNLLNKRGYRYNKKIGELQETKLKPRLRRGQIWVYTNDFGKQVSFIVHHVKGQYIYDSAFLGSALHTFATDDSSFSPVAIIGDSFDLYHLANKTERITAKAELKAFGYKYNTKTGFVESIGPECPWDFDKKTPEQEEKPKVIMHCEDLEKLISVSSNLADELPDSIIGIPLNKKKPNFFKRIAKWFNKIRID